MLSQQNSVRTYQLKDNYSQSKEMDLKTIELLEKQDPSAETLKLTTRWKEITKPGEYRYTQGQWKKYNPPRTLKGEQKKIEIELWQRKNKLLWQRMEGIVNTESPDETERRKEFHRATGVRYINMGKASKIQQNNEWDLEDTVRQVEQKFATDLKTIAGETTNDEKLLKTLVCIERKTLE